MEKITLIGRNHGVGTKKTGPHSFSFLEWSMVLKTQFFLVVDDEKAESIL